MQPSTHVRFKVCCIAGEDEARLAVRYGAAAIGLVSAMPSGPGVIAEDVIARIAAMVPPGIATFLLTSRTDAEGILEQQRRCRVNTLQLVDHVPHGELRRLRAELPDVALVQVIHVTGEESIEDARAVEPFVSAVLLDSGNPNLAVKELGGTGRVHNWDISRRIREALEIPVFLAGGLTPSNAAEAIRTVGPFALDVCSGVRSADRLDEAKLAAFSQAVLGFTR